VPAAGARGDDEAVIFTPAGFDRPGLPATLAAGDPAAARLEITVIDGRSGGPTACRLNVVGPDGRFYQPAEDRLSPYSLTGVWPKGRGNRPDKAPIRYFGRFFYTTGEATVMVPAGTVRVEAAKGLEYRPRSWSTRVSAGETRRVTLTLERVIDRAAVGHDAGDAHLHFRRESDADDALIFDLLEAEDIHYGAILAYNETVGPYTAVRDRLATPQLRGLGAASERARGDYHIISGQEHRSRTYGHLNLLGRNDLVREGESLNADNAPLYGLIGRQTRNRGGYAFSAHGGYAQSIYADVVQGDVHAVELLQFGVYRGIELDDWYRMLNAGFRLPCLGSSDYPACRKLADCVTYVRWDKPEADQRNTSFAGWLAGCAEGRSFVTTGLLLFLDVDGQEPGAVIAKAGGGPHKVKVRARTISLVAPVTSLQLIVNGQVMEELTVPASQGQGQWIALERPLELTSSSWIAARAFGKAATGSPDAEAHTNPVFVHLDGRSPYDRANLDRLVEKLDGQMAVHRARDFAEKAQVLDYFQTSHDILIKIRQAGGLPSGGLPRAWLDDPGRTDFDPGARAHTDAALAAFLQPVPPRTPAQALETFETTGGFRLELVAAEPLIHSPVAAAYDENGNLYVAEMIDYPYKPRPGQKPLGTVGLLRDNDGDGRFDTSHVFADGLLWPAGIAPWKGGVFVTAPPDIWYFKDTDGDHVADVRRKLFTGFGDDNEQMMLNNLVFGLDHKVYGSTSGNGGSVRPADRPQAPAISVKGRDFRFDPVAVTFEPITGTVQFGNTFDDFGNRFLCSQDRPLLHVVLPLEALARNPYLPVATGIENVAGSPVPVFRISPVEHWRQIRSSRRIVHGERPASASGASHHVIDAGAGVTIYRGGAYGAEYEGNAFVCDAQNNLIHRMRLSPAGATFRAERTDAQTEFVRSSDNWFRPVNLVNAPDGTLHVLDMSREVIEAVHIPLDVVRHLDLRRGRDQGRIYRIAPRGFRPSPFPRFGAMSTSELVGALESPSGWTRDTAHRLIFERQDRSATGLLERLATGGQSAAARVLALWSLAGLDALGDRLLGEALRDRSPQVVEQAVRLSEPRLTRSTSLLDQVAALADSGDARVRFAVALALGATRAPEAAALLAAIARRDAGDRWTRLAVLASAAELSDRLFAELAEDRSFAARREGVLFLEPLAAVVGARARPDEVERVLGVLAGREVTEANSALVRRIVLALGHGLKRSGRCLEAPGTPDSPAGRLLDSLLERADAEAREPSSTEAGRLEAIALMGCSPLARSRGAVMAALDGRSSSVIQSAALRALAAASEPEVAGLILDRFRQLTPPARAEAVTTLLSRASWTHALLEAARSDTTLAAALDSTHRALLMGHSDPEIANRARSLFGESAAALTPALLARFAPALRQAGEATRGGQVFDRLCATCHKIGERGHAVGPDLTATQFREPESLLTHIIDPNRSVKPGDVQYIVGDQSGRIFSGLVASETATSLTLRRAGGAEDTILRSQIEAISSTGKSLMPDDFSSRLTQDDAADLVAFLLQARTARLGGERLDIGTLPGLIEPDDRR
jgi:putative membrane-bound dehydrogenase-like protein